MSLAVLRPAFSEPDVRRLARDLYGLEGDLRPLPGERDQNFLIQTKGGQAFVLKIAMAGEERAVLDLQRRVLDHLAAHGRPGAFPRPVPTASGEAMGTVQGAGGQHHLVRLLTYVDGAPMARVVPQREELLHSLGAFLGDLDAALQGFDDPAAHRELDWDLRHAGDVVRERLVHVDDPARHALVAGFLGIYERDAAPLLPGLRTGLIHNDANDHNVLVNLPATAERSVVGLIDFGDLVHTYTVAEVAIAAAYAMLGQPDPLAAAATVVAGYHAAHPLREDELAVLFPLLCMRLCVSVATSALRRKEVPGDAYLTISEAPAWTLLDRLAGIHPRLATYTFRHACGLPPVPTADAVTRWIADHAAEAAPVVGLDLTQVPVRVCDLSIGSAESAGVDPADMAALSDDLFARMRRDGARVGIGRYDEVRGFYVAPQFAIAGLPETRRTVHVGMDLFLEAGAPVHAPFAGTVHSFADNNVGLDYGPTILLEHRTDDGTPFYTLYGHLSRASLDGLAEGQPIAHGQQIGALGDMDENGGWPPHLHFEVITDLLDRRGDFPGVAPAAARDVWLALCIDPFPLLGLTSVSSPAADELLAKRKETVGPSLSLSYEKSPLHIVRGAGAYLYDAHGRGYLDCVNNVAHVGHSHPRVARAIADQAGVLNTNTRYLHEHLVQYAERLVATLPDPLRVCFFVNSGSEANDLALRLARAHTGRRDVVVLDGAYHGHLTSLIDISPYKFNGPGGAGRPPHTHVVPMPDAYRGAHRGPDAAARYAGEVDTALAAAAAQGGAAAFFAEAILSCGGQVVPPEGFLRDAYARVRAGGGVGVADEVQVGFGRVGTHFWAFEAQGVVPDIVTMGKPIGNGHPLGAVVTTAEIAASFANGMEYFNTYGGNPVSMAAGLAVLDVMADEALQARALRVGGRLRAGLGGLFERHALIGDVRGQGLFLGVELVSDRATRAPAAAHAAYIATRLRELGILVSTDGPDHNVLKIKPPLAFSEADADRLVHALDTVLRDDYLRAAGRRV